MKVLIETQLKVLKEKTTNDFSALALMDEDGHIRWEFVAGNCNEKFKLMLKRPGQGLAGMVFRYGRIIVLDESIPNMVNKRLEFPIMIAENLVSAVGVPVWVGAVTRGILLVGSREPKRFSKNTIDLIQQTAKEISNIIYNWESQD